MALPSKATHQQTRGHNVRLVLRTLYDLGPLSRAEIARRTHLTRTTVSGLVGDLCGEGLVAEIGRGPSSGGKAPILLAVIADARRVIGLDLGEAVFTGALVNLRGELSHEVRVPVEGRDGADALQLVERLVDQLRTLSDGRLLGIGVGTPGIIDSRMGAIRWAVNLDWQDLQLGRLLEERTGLPVIVVNDSRAAAVAEYAFGSVGWSEPNLVAIKVGRGIGAGIVLDGELLRGDGAAAGEIGHLSVVDDGAECRCGRFGCLETVASARGIVERVRDGRAARLVEGRRPDHGAGEPLDLVGVQEAFERGDPDVVAIVLAAGQHLGRVIASMVGVLDVHHIVLHGTVTRFGEPWLTAVRDEASRRSLAFPAGHVDIELVALSENLVVLGASAMLLTRQLGLRPGR